MRKHQLPIYECPKPGRQESGACDSAVVALNVRDGGFRGFRSQLLPLMLVLFQCSPRPYDFPVESYPNRESGNYRQSAAVKTVMDELAKNVPGVAIAVRTDEGTWEYASGYARLESQTPMSSGHLQYLQSISKTYAAVCLLKLVEGGKVDLKQPITEYLPPAYSKYVARAGEITVEMLLNHTSGIPEYNSAPRYITRLLQAPDHPFQPVDYLTYIQGKPLDFEPGTKFSYRNTNFLLIALMLDALTGNHSTFMRKQIFEPLGLTSTYYAGDPGYLNYTLLVNTYWDRYSKGRVENVSVLQRNNVRAMVGDDGIVATPSDAVKFLSGLMEGKLISDNMLDRMKTWVNDSQGKATYGLGLDYANIGNSEAWGHSGGGIGAGCQLYYLPDKGLYYFIGINLGTVTESPLHSKVEKALHDLADIFQR